MENKEDFSKCWNQRQDDKGVSQRQHIVLEQLTKTAAIVPEHRPEQMSCQELCKCISYWGASSS